MSRGRRGDPIKLLEYDGDGFLSVCEASATVIRADSLAHAIAIPARIRADS